MRTHLLLELHTLAFTLIHLCQRLLACTLAGKQRVLSRLTQRIGRRAFDLRRRTRRLRLLEFCLQAVGPGSQRRSTRLRFSARHRLRRLSPRFRRLLPRRLQLLLNRLQLLLNRLQLTQVRVLDVRDGARCGIGHCLRLRSRLSLRVLETLACARGRRLEVSHCGCDRVPISSTPLELALGLCELIPHASYLSLCCLRQGLCLGEHAPLRLFGRCRRGFQRCTELGDRGIPPAQL